MRMLALGQYEAGVCECGIHESVASDPSNHFTFDTRTCPVCRGIARYARIQHHADEAERKQRGENTPPAMPDPSDGRRTFLKQLFPFEVEQMRSGRAAKKSPGEQAQPAK